MCPQLFTGISDNARFQLEMYKVKLGGRWEFVNCCKSESDETGLQTNINAIISSTRLESSNINFCLYIQSLYRSINLKFFL